MNSIRYISGMLRLSTAEHKFYLESGYNLQILLRDYYYSVTSPYCNIDWELVYFRLLYSQG